MPGTHRHQMCTHKRNLKKKKKKPTKENPQRKVILWGIAALGRGGQWADTVFAFKGLLLKMRFELERHSISSHQSTFSNICPCVDMLFNMDDELAC